MQARQEVLVNELQHRARNLLGVVSAVANRTVKQGGSAEAFEERLNALSRVQGLLSQGGSNTVEVGALVRAEARRACGQDGGSGHGFGTEGAPQSPTGAEFRAGAARTDHQCGEVRCLEGRRRPPVDYLGDWARPARTPSAHPELDRERVRRAPGRRAPARLRHRADPGGAALRAPGRG
ncbi:HWE histidine kinase domain-containing protein [Methylobacterium sp. P31]